MSNLEERQLDSGQPKGFRLVGFLQVRATLQILEDTLRPTSWVLLDWLMGVVYWCLFMWRAKWSDLEKLLSHWRHLNGLRPVCFRWCLVSSSERANRHSQPSQEHLYGFSPERKDQNIIFTWYKKTSIISL